MSFPFPESTSSISIILPKIAIKNKALANCVNVWRQITKANEVVRNKSQSFRKQNHEHMKMKTMMKKMIQNTGEGKHSTQLSHSWSWCQLKADAVMTSETHLCSDRVNVCCLGGVLCRDHRHWLHVTDVVVVGSDETLDTQTGWTDALRVT